MKVLNMDHKDDFWVLSCDICLIYLVLQQLYETLVLDNIQGDIENLKGTIFGTIRSLNLFQQFEDLIYAALFIRETGSENTL